MSNKKEKLPHACCCLCDCSLCIADWPNIKSARCPLLLPCGHTACRQCLISYANLRQSVTCRTCDTSIKINERTNVDETFPVNFYLLGVLMYKGAMHSPPKIKTTIHYTPAGASVLPQRPAMKVKPSYRGPSSKCIECSKHDATCSCEQCVAVYCQGCFIKVHRSAKALRHHVALPFSGKQVNSYSLGSCEKHPDHDLHFYCEQDKTSCCPKCAVLHHNGHKLVEIAEVNKEMLPELEEATVQMMKVLSQLVASKEQLEKILPGAEIDHLNTVKREVHEHFSQLHAWLQIREASICTELDVGCIGCYQDVGTMCSDIQEQIGNIHKLVQFSQLIKVPSMILNADVIKLLTDIRETISLPCKLLIPDESSPFNVKFNVFNNILCTIEDHCSLDISTRAPPTLIALSTEEFATIELISPNIPENESETISTTSGSQSDAEQAPQKAVTRTQRKMCKSPVMSECSSFLPEGSSELVVLSHVIDPSNFYIQHARDRNRLRELVKNLQLAGPSAKTLVDPIVGALCMVKYSIDAKWYRCRIKSQYKNDTGETMYLVFYIDYGNTEDVPGSRLKAIPDSLCTLQPLCKNCCLADCVPRNESWSIEAIQIFVEMTEDAKVQMFVRGYQGNSLMVDLVILNNDKISNYGPVFVRYTLIFLDYATITTGEMHNMEETQNSYKGSTYNNGLYHLGYNKSDQIVVSHIESPSMFYVQKIRQTSALSKLMENLKQFYDLSDSKHNLYCPQVGMCCVVKIPGDSNWYRAIVTCIPEKRNVSVQLVDFGNTITVDWKCLKKLHDKYMELDSQAIKCVMSDLRLPEGETEWTEDATALFHSLSYKQTLRMLVKRRFKDHVMVSLFVTKNQHEHCVATLMSQAGHGICYKKSYAQPSAKRSKTQAGASVEGELLEFGSQHRSMHGNYNRTRYKVPAATRAEPTMPVEAILAPSILTKKHKQPFQFITEENEYGILVKVIAHNSPGEVFVRIASIEPQLLKMMNDMQNYYEKNPDIDPNHEWHVEQLCALKRPSDGQWVRAVTVEIETKSVKIFLIDDAVVMEVAYSILRPLPDEFAAYIHGAIKCHLAGIRPAGGTDSWPIIAREFLSNLIAQYDNTYMTKKGSIENHSLPVEIWIDDIIEGGALEPMICKKSTINEKLVEHGVAIPIKNKSSTNVLTPGSEQVLKDLLHHNTSRFNISSTKYNFDNLYETLEQSGNETDSNSEPMVVDPTAGPSLRTYAQWLEPEGPSGLSITVKATYVDDQCNIYLQEFPRAERILTRLTNDIEGHYNTSMSTPEDLLWHEGQICIAKYHMDNKWYRGRVLKIMDETCDNLKIQFVDYGNTEELHVAELRRAAFVTTIPVQCFKCKFYDLFPPGGNKTWPTKILDVIHGSIVDNKCQVTFKEFTGPGNILEICSLKTEMGRDIFEYLLSNNMAQNSLSNEEPMLLSVTSADCSHIIRNLLRVPNAASEETSSENQSEGTSAEGPEESIDVVYENPGAASDVEIEDFEVLTINNDIENETLKKVGTVSQETSIAQKNSPKKTIQEEYMVVPDECNKYSLKEVTPVKSESIQVEYVHIEEDRQKADPNNDSVEFLAEVQSSSVPSRRSKFDNSVLTVKPPVAIPPIGNQFVICVTSGSDEDEDDDDMDGEDYPLLKKEVFPELTIFNNTLHSMEATLSISSTEFIARPIPENLNSEQTDPLQKLTQEINAAARRMRPLKEISLGLACCAPYGNDYYRGFITEVLPNDRACVTFVDYGNVAEIAIKELRPLKQSWCSLAKQAVICKVDKMSVVPGCDANVLDRELHSVLFNGPICVKFLKTESPPFLVNVMKTDKVTNAYQNLLDNGLLKCAD